MLDPVFTPFCIYSKAELDPEVRIIFFKITDIYVVLNQVLG